VWYDNAEILSPLHEKDPSWKFLGSHSVLVRLAQGEEKIEVAIPVRWHLAEWFILDPPHVFIVDVAGGAPRSHVFVLRSKDNADFAIKKWSSDSPGIGVSYEKKGPGEYHLQITPSSNHEKAFRRWEVDITTDCIAQPFVRIPVSAILTSESETKN
jgi:hypothetical protein